MACNKQHQYTHFSLWVWIYGVWRPRSYVYIFIHMITSVWFTNTNSIDVLGAVYIATLGTQTGIFRENYFNIIAGDARSQAITSHDNSYVGGFLSFMKKHWHDLRLSHIEEWCPMQVYSMFSEQIKTGIGLQNYSHKCMLAKWKYHRLLECK